MKYLLKDVKEQGPEDGTGQDIRKIDDPLFQKYQNLHDSDLFIEEKVSQKSQTSQNHAQPASLSPYKYANAKRQKSVKIYKSPNKEPVTPQKTKSPNRHASYNHKANYSRASAHRQNSKSIVEVQQMATNISRKNQDQNNSDKENQMMNIENGPNEIQIMDQEEMADIRIDKDKVNDSITILDTPEARESHINLESQEQKSCGSDEVKFIQEDQTLTRYNQSLSQNYVQIEGSDQVIIDKIQQSKQDKPSLIKLHKIQPSNIDQDQIVPNHQNIEISQQKYSSQNDEKNRKILSNQQSQNDKNLMRPIPTNKLHNRCEKQTNDQNLIHVGTNQHKLEQIIQNNIRQNKHNPHDPQDSKILESEEMPNSDMPQMVQINEAYSQQLKSQSQSFYQQIDKKISPQKQYQNICIDNSQSIRQTQQSQIQQNQHSMDFSDQFEAAQISEEQQERMELNSFMWKFLKQTNKQYMEQQIVHNIGKDIKYSIEKDDFLRQLADKSISPQDRKSLIFWLLELKKNYNFQDQTIMATIIYCDRYIQKNRFVERKVYQLIMIVCLIIAVKNYEDVVLTYEQGSQICGNVFSQDMIAMVERDILEKLDFQLNHPTSLDFCLQMLLVNYAQSETYLSQYQATNDNKNYQMLDHINITIQRCIPLIYLCQKDYETNMRNSQLTIALAVMIFVIYEQATKIQSFSEGQSVQMLQNEYLQRIQNGSTMINYILQMVQKVFLSKQNDIHGLQFKQIFDTTESLFKFLQERSLNKKIQTMDALMQQHPLYHALTTPAHITLDEHGDFLFGYSKQDIKFNQIRKQPNLTMDQTNNFSQIPNKAPQSIQKQQLIIPVQSQQNKIECIEQINLDDDDNATDECMHTVREPPSKNITTILIDDQPQQDHILNPSLSHANVNFIEKVENLNENDLLLQNQGQSNDILNKAMIIENKMSNDICEQVFDDDKQCMMTISDNDSNLDTQNQCKIKELDKHNKKLVIDKTKKSANYPPPKQIDQVQNKMSRQALECQRISLLAAPQMNKTTVFRNSASPDESTVATHYMRSQYGSPEEIGQVQKVGKKTSLIEKSSGKKSPSTKDNLQPSQKCIEKEQQKCLQARGKSTGQKSAKSSKLIKDIIRNKSRDKLNRALQLKFQQSSGNSKRSRISKESNTCTQKTLSLSKMKQYSSNKKNGVANKLKKFLNCDEKLYTNDNNHLQYQQQSILLYAPNEKMHQSQSATKKQLYQAKLGFNFKKKENRRMQNRLRVAIQRQETKDNEDKAKTAAKIFMHRKNEEFSASPQLDFDSGDKGNTCEQNYRIKSNLNELHNQMNVSSFDVQQSARDQNNQAVIEKQQQQQIDSVKDPPSNKESAMIIDEKQPQLVVGQRLSKSNGTLLPAHSPSKLGINCDLTEIKFDEFSKNCMTSTNKNMQDRKLCGASINLDSQQVVIDLMEDSKKELIYNGSVIHQNELMSNTYAIECGPTTASEKYSHDKFSSTNGHSYQKQSLIQLSQNSISQFQINGLGSSGNNMSQNQKEPKDFKKVEEELQRIKNVCNIGMGASLMRPQLQTQSNLAMMLKSGKLQKLIKTKDKDVICKNSPIRVTGSVKIRDESKSCIDQM